MELEIFELNPHSKKKIWFCDLPVPAGKALENEGEFKQVDVNAFFTSGNAGVCLIRVVGDSMEEEIRTGDHIIVDRNIEAKNGDMVVASVNGEYTIKELCHTDEGLSLVATNEKYLARDVSEEDDFEIFGVITYVVRSLKKI